jgi:hypothetical protein
MKSIKEIAKTTKPVKQYLKTFITRYDELFRGIRDKQITLLEIGVGGYKNPEKGGGSLLMWSEYFPNATIIGLDINEKKINMPSNVTILRGSQVDTNLLNELSIKYGGFDIVIDDGSHITHNTITTFEALQHHTRLFYIIEDLHMAKAYGTKEYFNDVEGSDFSTEHLCVISKSNQ